MNELYEFVKNDEERYNILEGHGHKAMAREILDAQIYNLDGGGYAIVQAGKGFASQVIECKCKLEDEYCANCSPANKEIGYPPMPSGSVSPDYFEMWEI